MPAVNPEILIRARETAGLTPEEAGGLPDLDGGGKGADGSRWVNFEPV